MYPILFNSEPEELAYCGWMEDRSGIGAAYAVMHVVMNRVRSPLFPNTIHAVIFQTNAFSWTRTDNPEYGLPPAGAIYDACLQSAQYVILGDDDPTKNAVWYANEAVISPTCWYALNIIQTGSHPITVKIGQHTFRT